MITPDERILLDDLLRANKDTQVENTDLIRKLKHSSKFRAEIAHLIALRATHDEKELHMMGPAECPFLFNYYTDIFNRLRKDEIDLDTLYRFIDILEQIEEGKINQNEGSVLAGKILKEIFVDSSIKKTEKINAAADAAAAKEKEEEKKELKTPQVEITFAEFKEIVLHKEWLEKQKKQKHKK